MTQPYDDSRRARRSLLLAAGVVLVCWLLAPALTPVHVEGFSGQIQSLALFAQGQTVLAHDPFLPLITEFIYLTRAGVVHLLATIYEATGTHGDWAFRTVTILSLIVVLAAALIFAGRWTRIPLSASLVALILTPGIAETGFFFNDNIVSAAFAGLAMAVIHPESRTTAYGMSGALLALAILCRLDAILVVPILAFMALSVRASIGTYAARGLTALCGFFIILGLAEALTEFSTISAFRIAGEFKAVVERWYSFDDTLMTFLYFFGPIMPFVLPVGAAHIVREEWRQHNIFRIAALVGYPLLLIGYALYVSREVRYIYPLLAPVIAVVGGRGVEHIRIYLESGSSWKRRTAAVFLACAVIVSISPPAFLWISSVSDGPRVVLGRLWSPLLWFRWQDAVRLSMDRIDRAVTDIRQSENVMLISTHHNDAFYIRLRLFEVGYRPVHPTELAGDCRNVSVYRHGSRNIYHVRTEPQYTLGGFSFDEATALQLVAALKCSKIRTVERAYLTVFGGNPSRLDREIYNVSIKDFRGPTDVEFPYDLWDIARHRLGGEDTRSRSYELFDILLLSHHDVTSLEAMSAQYSSASDRIRENGGPEEAFDRFHRAFDGRYISVPGQAASDIR